MAFGKARLMYATFLFSIVIAIFHTIGFLLPEWLTYEYTDQYGIFQFSIDFGVWKTCTNTPMDDATPPHSLNPNSTATIDSAPAMAGSDSRSSDAAFYTVAARLNRFLSLSVDAGSGSGSGSSCTPVTRLKDCAKMYGAGDDDTLYQRCRQFAIGVQIIGSFAMALSLLAVLLFLICCTVHFLRSKHRVLATLCLPVCITLCVPGTIKWFLGVFQRISFFVLFCAGLCSLTTMSVFVHWHRTSGIESDSELRYGASFILWTIGWVLCMLVTVLACVRLHRKRLAQSINSDFQALK